MSSLRGTTRSFLFELAAFITLIGAASASAHDESPEDSVERAARKYRIGVYERFRLDRAEYDRRRALGDRVMDAWRSAGSPRDQAPIVASWFAGAESSSHSSRQAVPPLPPPIARPTAPSPAETADGPAPKVGAEPRSQTAVPSPESTPGTAQTRESIDGESGNGSSGVTDEGASTVAALESDPLAASPSEGRSTPRAKGSAIWRSLIDIAVVTRGTAR